MLFNCIKNNTHHCVQFCQYLTVIKPQHFYTHRLQLLISFHISNLMIRLKMLRTIKLNNEIGGCAIKINDVVSQGFLTIKLQAQYLLAAQF